MLTIDPTYPPSGLSRDYNLFLVDASATDGKADFLKQFAYPLPLTVLAEVVGFPQADVQRIKWWSDNKVRLQWGNLSTEEAVETARAHVDFLRYLTDLVEARRADARDDIITTLINVRVDEETPLTIEEIVGQLQAFVSAGHETTRNLIAHALDDRVRVGQAPQERGHALPPPEGLQLLHGVPLFLSNLQPHLSLDDPRSSITHRLAGRPQPVARAGRRRTARGASARADLRSAGPRSAGGCNGVLSNRELRVLRLIAAGLRNRQIADRLG